MAPAAPNLRFIPVNDEDANYAFHWMRRLFTVAVYGYFTAECWLALRLSDGGYDVIRTLVGLVLAILILILILQTRDGVARRIRRETGADRIEGLHPIRRWLSEVWHLLAIFYLTAAFVIWELRFEGGAALILRGSLVTIAAAYIGILAVRGADRLIRKALGINDELRARYPGLEVRATRYVGILKTLVRIVVAAVFLVVALQAWDLEPFVLIASEAGQRLLGFALTIMLLILLSIAIWEFVSAAIQRYLTRASEDSAAVSARAKTLLPILRNALLSVLVVIFVMVVLSELGLDIGPLLAGAGVIGIAIGFGAQTLFKDIITGIFILTEDQIAVGDVIRVDTHAGLVEGLTIRTIKLRDLQGIVHIIPFGEVRTLENLTKDYSRYLLEVGVAYREDPDEVMDVLAEIGQELSDDPYYGPMMLEPIEIFGVDRFADSAIIIRARLTTKPIKQWEVGREFNRRMKLVFDERGIEIPFPHRTLWFGEGKDGAAPSARVHTGNIEDLPTPPPRETRERADPARHRRRSQRRGSGSSDEGDGT